MKRLFALSLLLGVIAVACSEEPHVVDVGAADEYEPASVTTFALLDNGETVAIARGGSPVLDVEGLGEEVFFALPRLQFHLVRIGEDEFLALYAADPISGCLVPWRPEMEFRVNDQWAGVGWFRDPCYGGTYDITGRRVFGPPPQDMDRFPVTVEDGRVLVTADFDAVVRGQPRLQGVGNDMRPPSIATP